ncbi:MAG: hypothetical protein MJ247_03275, partial [Alphaproteobacteria bacterium]|nr:hypothetical protein [Alphaproteobacteria bacterium]
NYFGIESELTSSGKNLYLDLKNYSLSLDLSDSSINYSLAIQELMNDEPDIDLVNHYFNKMDKLLHIQQMNVYSYFAKTFVNLPKSDKELYRKLYFQNKELLKYQMLNLPYLIGIDFSNKEILKNNKFRKVPNILH